MIQLRNLTGEEIKAIGRRIGEAFYDEGEGLFTRLDREDAITTLEIMTECYYRLGVLYTTSEQQEGYLAYWRKGEAKEWGMKMVRVSLHMAWRFLREIPFGSLKKLLPLMNNPYEKIYQKELDYVAISMVAVRREFQGQGYLRVLLEEPFRIARERNIPCVLDTDTELKVKKYISCGMKKTAETPIKGGGTMYTMEHQKKISQPTIHLGTHGENYGTWMSHPVFYMMGGFALAALILAVLSFTVFHIIALGVIFLVVLIALIAFIGWMEWIRRQYAFGGGGMMEKGHQTMLSLLDYDGNGTLLEVGCGSGPFGKPACFEKGRRFCHQ